MSLLRKFEVTLSLLALSVGVTFLLLMCHLSFAINTVFGILFLTLFYVYVRKRHRIDMPPSLLVLVFAALQVDALGNLFRLYGTSVGPFQYDELSHLSVQALVSPIIVWLVHRGFSRWGSRLPIPVTAFVAGSVLFSLSAFYEIIELWDHLYLHPGRIWGPLDTATDLQFDLCGIMIGTTLGCLMLSARQTSSKPVLSGSEV